MSRNLPDIEDLFRDSIEPHEEMPPDRVWNEIDHSLDKKSEANTNRKYNRLKWLSAAMLLALLGTIVYELQTNYKGRFNGNAVTDNANLSKNNMTKEGARQENITIPVTDKNKTAGKDVIVTDANNTTGNNVNQPAEKIQPAENPATKPDVNAVSALKAHLNAGKEKMNGAIENKVVTKSYSIRIKGNIGASLKRDIVDSRQSSLKQTNAYTAEDQLASDKTTLNVITSSRLAVTDQPTATEIIAYKKENNLRAAVIQRSPALLSYNVSAFAPLLQPGIQPAPVLLAKKQAPFHFSIIPFIAPQFTFNRIVDNDDHRMGGQRQNDADDIKKDESHQRSYAFGLLIDVPLKKRWSLQSGISYINKTIEIEPKKIYARNVNGSVQYRFDFSSGYTYLSTKNWGTPVVGDSVQATESSSNLQYLGVPLTINYRFLNGKFNIIPTVGGMVNFLIKEKIKTNVEAGTSSNTQNINSIQGLKRIYFNTITGITFQYNASKILALDVAPSANFAMGTINSNAAVKSYPNAFSIAAGLRIYF